MRSGTCRYVSVFYLVSTGRDVGDWFSALTGLARVINGHHHSAYSIISMGSSVIVIDHLLLYSDHDKSFATSAVR